MGEKKDFTLPVQLPTSGQNMLYFTSVTSELCQQVGLFCSQGAKQAYQTVGRWKDAELISEYSENVENS